MAAPHSNYSATLRALTASSTVTQAPAVFDSVSVYGGKAVFHNGSSTTAAVLTVRGTTAQSGSVVFPRGLRFDAGWAVTITGTSALVTLALR